MATKDATFQGLLKDIEAGRFQPIYLCYGEEPYLVHELQQKLLARALAPHERDFNLDVIDGTEAEGPAVLAACHAYPMMAERRVIVVSDFEKLKQNDVFNAYADRPNPSAVVFLKCGGRPNLSTNPYRAIKTKWGAFDSKHLNARQLPAWVRDKARSLKCGIEPAAATLLGEYVGNSLGNLAAELQKLATFVGDRAHITEHDVVAITGQSPEHNVFALQRAVGLREYKKAAETAERLLQQSSNRKGEALMLVSFLTGYFGKLWKLSNCRSARVPYSEWASTVGVPPYFLKEYQAALDHYDTIRIGTAFSALLAADAELKGGSQRDDRHIIGLMLHKVIIR